MVMRGLEESRLGFSSLRGSSMDSTDMLVDEIMAREEAEAWEPESMPNPRFSFGDTGRGPVKGGVEVYPLQVRGQQKS